MNITKRVLARRIALATGQPVTHVRRTIQMLLDEITSELAAGNRIEFRDFGVFDVHERAARVARNLNTRERVDVPARRVVRFRPTPR